jgi:hypothetical protein
MNQYEAENMLNVEQILKKWLKDNGYDGLYCSGCGCSINDLAPCGMIYIMDCHPGYKGPGNSQEGWDFTIGPEDFSVGPKKHE